MLTVAGGGGLSLPGVTSDPSPPGSVDVVGRIHAAYFGALDRDTTSTFDGGLTAGSQGITSSPDIGNWALDCYWNDAGHQRAAFRVLDDGSANAFYDFEVDGKIKVGSSVTHTLGAYSGTSVPIYDESGTLLGYMPLYA